MKFIADKVVYYIIDKSNFSDGGMHMQYLTSVEIAEKWGVSERSVRNYCANDRVKDCKLIGKSTCAL